MLSPPIEFHFLKPYRASAPETGFADVRVVTLAELAPEDRGWTRGHVHIGFDDVPKDALGRLDFFPVTLVALQTIDAGKGYAMHPHTDIESITLVLEGTMCHEDSLGNVARIGPSEVSVLSAGHGIEHAEFIDAASDGRALLFWVTPSELGAEPSFRKAAFPKAERVNRLVAVASGRSDAPLKALPLLRDVTLFAAHLTPDGLVRHRLDGARRAYLFATDAAITVNGCRAEAGERVLARGPGEIEVRAHGTTELVLLDVD